MTILVYIGTGLAVLIILFLLIQFTSFVSSIPDRAIRIAEKRERRKKWVEENLNIYKWLKDNSK